MTLVEFNALVARRNEAIEMEEKRVAGIMATIMNSTRWGHIADKHPKEYTVEDFIGKKGKKGKSWQEMYQFAQMFTVAAKNNKSKNNK